MASEPYERLREARLRAGFATPADAAKRFNWNANTYKSHENGIRGITRTSAERYGRAFHVSPGWLLTGEGTPPPLTPEESAVLARFRLLDGARRQVLRDMAESLLGSMPDRIPALSPSRRKPSS